MISDPKAESLLIKIGSFSRLAVFLLQFLANFLPDHDADAFNPPPIPDPTTNASHPSPSVDTFVYYRLLHGFAKWDSLHFLQVAEFGYLFESDLAFFPAFPLTLRLVDVVLLRPIFRDGLKTRTRLLLAAVVVNNVAFIIAGVSLYRLSRRWLDSPTASFIAVVFFYFNPASIFFSAAYSESLFFAALVAALSLFYRRRLAPSALVFAFCGAVRSNAVLFVGFFWFSWLNRVYENVAIPAVGSGIRTGRLFVESIKALLLTGVSLSLFVVYQSYVATTFCHRTSSPPEVPSHLRPMALDDEALIIGAHKLSRGDGTWRLTAVDFPSWCENSRFQFSYSDVQNKYWNLGFFAYYRPKQIPNFILATPVVFITILWIKGFVHAKRGRGGGVEGVKGRLLELVMVNFVKKEEREEEEESGLASKLHTAECLPFYLYTSFLLAFGLSFMHVQVLTRMLFSSCPILYLYVGSRFHRSSDSLDVKRLETAVQGGEGVVTVLSRIIAMAQNTRFQKLIVLYCISYLAVGTALHCNFLPWT